MVPDASKLHPVPEMLTFHDSMVANVFWAHRTLDRLDPGDSTVWASAALALLIGATILAERRSYRTPEPIRSGLEGTVVLDRE